MLQIQKNKLSFDIKILNSNSKKKFTRSNIISNPKKDIFIRKQDIYLINLLEKRIKLTKLLKMKKPEPDLNQIKMSNPFLFKIYQNNSDKATQTNLENYKNRFNPFLNYKSIGSFHNKKKYENKSYVNDEKDKNITLNNFDNLITSKIYNKDDSRNNKNILKIITGEKNFYDTKYNDTLTNSLHNKTKKLDVHLSIEKINLPKINKNKITKIMRNSRNINNNKNSLRNFKTIVIKRKKNYNTEGNISLTERIIKKENKENAENDKEFNNNKNNFNNINNIIENTKYKYIFDVHSISPIRHINKY